MATPIGEIEVQMDGNATRGAEPIDIGALAARRAQRTTNPAMAACWLVSLAILLIAAFTQWRSVIGDT